MKIVNLGGDADTTGMQINKKEEKEKERKQINNVIKGAIYGQIAGTFYGFESIPQNWVSKSNY